MDSAGDQHLHIGEWEDIDTEVDTYIAIKGGSGVDLPNWKTNFRQNASNVLTIRSSRSVSHNLLYII